MLNLTLTFDEVVVVCRLLSYVGWMALAVFPFSVVQRMSVLSSAWVTAFVYCALVALQYSDWAGGTWASALTGWMHGAPQWAEELRHLHSLVADLWLGQWMVLDFWTHYTAGYAVVPNVDGGFSAFQPWTPARLLFSLLLAVTAASGPFGFALYWLAKWTLLAGSKASSPINPQLPVHLGSNEWVAIEAPMLDKRFVRFGDALPPPLSSLYHLWAGIVGLCCLVGALMAYLGLFVYSACVQWPLCWEGVQWLVKALWCRLQCFVTATPPPPLAEVHTPPMFVRRAVAELQWRQMLVAPDKRRLPWQMLHIVLQVATVHEYAANKDQSRQLFFDLRDGFRKSPTLLASLEKLGKKPKGTKVHTFAADENHSNGRSHRAEPPKAEPPQVDTSTVPFFPWGDGVGVSSHKLVRRYAQAAPRKDTQSAGWSCSSSNRLWCDFTSIYQPTMVADPHKAGQQVENPLVTLSWGIVHAWMAHFPHQLQYGTEHETTGKHADLLVHLDRIVPRVYTAQPAARLVSQAVGETMFFCATGGLLRKGERDAYLDCVNVPAMFMPDWLNFFLGGHALERKNWRSYETMRAAFHRHAGDAAMKAAFAAGVAGGKSESEVLRLLTLIFCAAGGPGPCVLAQAVVQRLWAKAPGESYPQHWPRKYHEDPKRFILEAARLSFAFPMLNILATPEIIADVHEHTGFTIPPDTRIHCAATCANVDPLEFKDPNTFNPDREELGKLILWNGMDGDIEEVDVPGCGAKQKSWRACPGRDFAIRIVRYVADRFGPVLQLPADVVDKGAPPAIGTAPMAVTAVTAPKFSLYIDPKAEKPDTSVPTPP